ncbi:MAG: hypothetical protein LBL35_06450 [Clostridiales bacterium]|jgi:hypothetical protein|nr:hypothetical protein [Clostridiales bacterium]
MQNLTQPELNSIREVAMAHQTLHTKFTNYASQCNDPQIKQMFTKAATDAQNAAQNLIQML